MMTTNFSNNPNIYAEELKYPRITGTEGEKNAQIYIFNTLKKFNFKPETEDFVWRPDEKKNLNRFLILGLGSLIIGIILLGFKQYISLGLLNAIQWIIFNYFVRGKFHRKRKRLKEKSDDFSQFLKSRNIYIELLSKKHKEFQSKMAYVLFLTHYDTSNSKLSRELYMQTLFGTLLSAIFHIFFGIVIGGVSLLAHFQLVNLQDSMIQIFSWIVLIAGIICFFFGSMILYNNIVKNPTSTESDASGCAVLLGLAELIKSLQLELEWIDLRFVFVGAKYGGFQGALAHYTRHQRELRDYHDKYLINLNRLGNSVKMQTKMHGSPTQNLNTMIQELILHLAHRNKIQISLSSLPLMIQSEVFPFQQLEKEMGIAEFTTNRLRNLSQTKKKANVSSTVDLTPYIHLFYDLLLMLDKRIQDKINLAE